MSGCYRTYSTFNSFRRHLILVLSELLTDNHSTAETPQLSDVGIQQCTSDIDDSSQSAIEEKLCPAAVDSHGVPLAGANLLMNLCACNSLTLTNVTFVKNTVKELVSEVVSHLQDRTQAVLASAGCESVCGAKELMLDFDAWKNPFWGMDSHRQLKKYMERNHLLIEPVSSVMVLGGKQSIGVIRIHVIRFRSLIHFATFPMKAL